MREDQMAVPADIGAEDSTAWRAVLRSPFRHLLWANIANSIGDWIGLVAILALTEAILGSTRAASFALAGIMIARVAPAMLLGPVAGVLADRWNRRNLLIVTDLVRCVIFVFLPFVDDIWALVLVTLFVEVMSTVFIPAKDAMVPRLIGEEHLTFANQLSMISTYATLPLGGFFFAGFVWIGAQFPEGSFVAERPLALALWFDAATYLVSAWFVTRIKGLDDDRSRRTDTGAPGAWQELVEGLRFIANKPLVRALVFGVAGAFLGAGVAIGVGELFVTVVDGGDSGLGVLQGFLGSGLLLGVAIAGPAEKRVGRERLFAPGLAVAGIFLVGTALMPTLELAAPLAFVMGFGGGVSFITGYTMLQDHSTDAVRGRTMAAFNTGVRGALFASLVAGPALVGIIGIEGNGVPGAAYSIGGVRITLMLAGMATLVGAVVTGRSIHRVLSDVESLDLGRGNGSGVKLPGLFVAFEGGEGSGKTTQARLLRAAVERAGHDTTVTREPGGTAIGERIRELVLDPTVAHMGDRSEALLYAASRAQHVEDVIRPALEKGHVVICDRFLDSSIVYQGVARGLGETQVAELNRWAVENLVPDLVVVLDVDAVEGLRRAGNEQDRLEAAGIEFHRAVNSAFRRRAASDPERFLLLDAQLPAEQLHARIRDAVLALLDGTRRAEDELDQAPAEVDEDPPPVPNQVLSEGAATVRLDQPED